MDVTIDITKTIIETKRLILRPWLEADLFDFYEYASMPGVGEMAGWECHKSYNTSRRVMQTFMDEKNVFVIVHKQDNKAVGSFGLHKSWADEDDRFKDIRVKDIGYVLSKDYWGQGLMPEAVGAVVEHGFTKLDIEAFTCGHFKENIRSKRVIEKCGFAFVKESEYYAVQLHKTFDDLKYILIRNAEDAYSH